MPVSQRKASRRTRSVAPQRGSRSPSSPPLRTLLRNRMAEDGFTSVDQLAAHIGVSRNSLNRAMTSDSRPNSRTYQLYAEYLGLPSPKVTPKSRDLTSGMRRALACIEQECIHNAFPRLLERDFDTLCKIARSPIACSRFTKQLSQVRRQSDLEQPEPPALISDTMMRAIADFQAACLRRAFPRLDPKAIAALAKLSPSRYELLQVKSGLKQQPHQ